MNLERFTTQFTHNAEAIRGLAQGLSEVQARWKPEPEEWSILEVVNHLYDEEREDFRQRLDLLLHHPGESWLGIDPPAWAVERKYNERELEHSLQNFLKEREKSLDWLKNLVAPNWEATYEHPAVGLLSARDMLSAWLAHDFLHLRQLTELHWAYHAQAVAPARIEYAGDW